MLPFTTAASFNPEDLWNWMASYEDKSGGQVLALVRNGNLSNGIMFLETKAETCKSLTKDYAEARSRWEPLYEITQIKGDSESHPLLSPNDEFAGYGALCDKGNLGPVPKEDSMLQYEYAPRGIKEWLGNRKYAWR